MPRPGKPIVTVFAVLLSSICCGEGANSPGGPSGPPQPESGANLVVASSLTFGTCSTPGCEYAIEYRNDGVGCANNLRGKVRSYQLESLLETDDWFLDASIVVEPGDSIRIEDCCFSRDTVQRQTRFTSEQFWNNVSCN